MNPNRELVPFSTADMSAFCKSLRMQLAEAEVSPLPSHVALLNMLARSAGHRNYQALRAAPAPAAPPTVAAITPLEMPRDPALSRIAARAITHFDSAGRLTRWPTQYAVQQQALWALWVRLPAKRDLNEATVNEYLARYNTLGDFATLRRELVNAKFLWRTTDGRTYRKEMRQPDMDSAAFLKVFHAAVIHPAPAGSSRAR